MFGNYKAPRALHAYNWYEIMQLPEALMPLTLAYSTIATDTNKSILANITNSIMLHGKNELLGAKKRTIEPLPVSLASRDTLPCAFECL